MKIRKRSLAGLALSLLGVLVAQTLAAQTLSAPAAAPAAAAGSGVYTLVYLKTGPKSGQLSEAENKEAFIGHFSNMTRLASERKLLVAGPFGKERHAADLRGLFILATGDRQEAETWAGTDPTTKAGVFVLEYHRLETAAPLAAALERYFANEEKARQEGRELKMEETMRHYVWLLADGREKARLALAPLFDKGQAFLTGNYDENQLLVLLDAENAEAAKAAYGEALAKLGTYSLDEWFGSLELAKP